MSNQNEPKEALTEAEMAELANSVIPKATGQSVVNTENLPSTGVPVPGQDDAAKISANAETVRLPTMADLQNLNREELTPAGSEVVHENVQVGKPDYNYVPPADAIKDEVNPGIAQDMAAIEAAKQAQQQPTSGIVIENKAEEGPKELPGLSQATQENIEKYMSTMEDDMRESTGIRAEMAGVNPNLAPTEDQFQAVQEQIALEEGASTDAARSSDNEESERSRKYREAVVVIDKIEAKNLQFTKEERAKLESADVIRVNEVKTVDLKAIRRRREKTMDVHKAIQRRGNSMRHTSILLPGSGYYAEMLGCAPYEIMTLQNEDDPLTDSQVKWSLIYEKMKWNSIGINSFEEFMNSTAIADYETFIWGILRSTFEDTDKISLNCTNPKCEAKKGVPYSYEHNYSVTGLLRAEDITERLNESIVRVVNAKTLEEAKVAHQLAPINDILAIELPDSGFVPEIGISTVNEFLTKTLEHLSDDNLEPQHRQAALIATALKGINIPDETGEYNYFTEQEEMTEIIYKLSASDLVILAHKVQEHTSGVSFNFGFIDLQCPKCAHKTPHQPMEVASILFYRNALSMNVSVE